MFAKILIYLFGGWARFGMLSDGTSFRFERLTRRSAWKIGRTGLAGVFPLGGHVKAGGIVPVYGKLFRRLPR